MHFCIQKFEVNMRERERERERRERESMREWGWIEDV